MMKFRTILLSLLWSSLMAVADTSQDLIKAVDLGDVAQVKQLLAKGANANAVVKTNLAGPLLLDTPGTTEVVRLLLEKGANPNIRFAGGFPQVYSRDGQPFVSFGMGATPLQIASFRGLPEVVKTLLDTGADPNVGLKGGSGITPLTLALTRLRKPWDPEAPISLDPSTNPSSVPSSVALAIRVAAALPNSTLTGGTPLMFACELNRKDIVQLLLERGADTSVRDGKGRTALMIAKERGFQDLVELLRIRSPETAAAPLVAPPPPPGVYRAGGSVTAPTTGRFGSTWRDPKYPDEARLAKVMGDVVLSVVVDADGSTQDVQVFRSLGPSLDQNAIEAVRQWKFQPGQKDGQSVSVQVQIVVHFSPNMKHCCGILNTPSWLPAY
jgi:protein TonB